MKMSKNKSLHCTKVWQTGCDEGGRLGRRIDCLRSPISTAPFYSLYGLLERFGQKYETYLHFAKIWFVDVNFHACKLIFKNNRHRLFRFNFNRIWIETIYNSRGFTEVFFNYFVQIILNFNIIIFTYLHINIIWKSEYSCIHITKCKQHQTILKWWWTTKYIIVKHGGHKLSHN